MANVVNDLAVFHDVAVNYSRICAVERTSEDGTQYTILLDGGHKISCKGADYKNFLDGWAEWNRCVIEHREK